MCVTEPPHQLITWKLVLFEVADVEDEHDALAWLQSTMGKPAQVNYPFKFFLLFSLSPYFLYVRAVSHIIKSWKTDSG